MNKEKLYEKIKLKQSFEYKGRVYEWCNLHETYEYNDGFGNRIAVNIEDIIIEDTPKEDKKIEKITELLKDFKTFENSDCIYELSSQDCKILLDYINNLQEEVENLREEDWAWHQVLKMQNKREYRSKFLKDFQKEYGTNTYPDYDEIYKRYDKTKLKINKAIELIKNNICGGSINNANELLKILDDEYDEILEKVNGDSNE